MTTVLNPPVKTNKVSFEKILFDASADFGLFIPTLVASRQIKIRHHLVAITSDVKAALLLNQALYWTRNGDDVLKSDGWFNKSAADWINELGMSQKNLVTARKSLAQLGFLESALQGCPATLYYRVNLPAVYAAIESRFSHPVRQMSLADLRLQGNHSSMSNVFGPTFSYHSIFAPKLGVKAAMLLSRLIYLHRVNARTQSWVQLDRQKLALDLGLSRYEQESARKCLREASLLKEAHLGFSRGIAMQLQMAALKTFIYTEMGLGHGLADQETAKLGQNQFCRFPPIRDDATLNPKRFTTDSEGNKSNTSLNNVPAIKNGKTGFAETSLQALPLPTRQFYRNQPASFAVSRLSCVRANKEVKNLLLKPTPTNLISSNTFHDAAENGKTSDQVVGVSLIFPKFILHQEERDSIIDVFQELSVNTPIKQQEILDEMEFCNNRKKVLSPVGLARCLSRGMQQGTFKAAGGFKIRKDRETIKNLIQPTNHPEPAPVDKTVAIEKIQGLKQILRSTNNVNN